MTGTVKGDLVTGRQIDSLAWEEMDLVKPLRPERRVTGCVESIDWLAEGVVSIYAAGEHNRLVWIVLDDGVEEAPKFADPLTALLEQYAATDRGGIAPEELLFMDFLAVIAKQQRDLIDRLDRR